jgi:hypothetical protein
VGALIAVGLLPWGGAAEPASPREEPPDPAAAVELTPVSAEKDFRQLYGATPVTRAVDRGLDYLARTQLPDGSWLAPGFGKNTGVVGLSALAFLAAGHPPGRGPHGERVEKAVAFLLRSRENGLFVTSDRLWGRMYEHGIVTLLMGQIAGMVGEQRPEYRGFHEAYAEAVEIILRAQSVPRSSRFDLGGWRYEPNSTDSDISVTGWQLLALRAAQEAGLPVPKRSIDQAVLYVKRCQQPAGSFGYMPSDPKTTLARTGTGVLSLQICGEFQSPEARAGGDWLLKAPLAWKGDFFYYGLYYAAQAMYQLGGPYWEGWRRAGETVLLEHQGADGSWVAPADAPYESRAGAAYSTALAVLSLTVEYRYLPIYQR